MSQNRFVRLGIVYRGNIIQEETLDRRIDVSVGIRPGSTVQIAPKDYPDFPDAIDLLALDGGQYYLVVPSDPTARISMRGAAVTSEAKNIKGKRCLPVEGIAGGSLVIGDVTIMFQFVRGDATPTVTRDRMVLRLGLVFDDRLISDQIYPDQKIITIGNGKEDSVVLPTEDYQGPAISFTNNKDGSADLRCPQSLKVRVAIDGSPMELKDLQQKGKARAEGNDVICHLPLGSRGRAVMGAHTVLFQMVKQSVTVPAMHKPTGLQRFTSVFLGDPTWSTAFLSSVLLVGAIVGQALIFNAHTGKYLKDVKPEDEHKFDTIVVQIEEKKVEEPPEKPDDKPTQPLQAPDPTPAKKQKDDKPTKADKDPVKDAPKPDSIGKTADNPEDVKRIDRAVVEKNTLAGAFGGPGAATKLFGTAGEGEEGTVVAKSFGNGGGDKEGTGPGSGGLKLEGGQHSGTVEKVPVSGKKGFDRDANVAKPVEKKPEEKAVVAHLSLGDMSGSGEGKSDVAKVISRKNNAVQLCYEMALRSNPEEGGKVKVTFTVGTAGTVTEVTVSGASGTFSDCIKNKFMAIRGLPLLPSEQSFTQSYVFSKGG